MIFNTNISIALKNSSGCYSLKKISVFEISEINKSFASLRVRVYNKIIYFEVKCPFCGKYHHYQYAINELIKKDITVGGCEILGLPLFYMGNYDKVEQIVNKHNNVNKQMCAML